MTDPDHKNPIFVKIKALYEQWIGDLIKSQENAPLNPPSQLIQPKEVQPREAEISKSLTHFFESRKQQKKAVKENPTLVGPKKNRY